MQEVLMRAWWLIPVVFAAAACHSDSTSPGTGRVPDVPTGLVGTSLNGAIALVWDDNAFAADPNGFQNYRVFSTTYTFASNDYLNGQCGSTWKLEGSTVAPEFVVGALSNGVAQCFAVSAIGVDQQESARSAPRNDTPRPDARNVVVFARQVQAAQSGFRFWQDLNGDGQVQANELGLVISGNSPDADFSVERFRTAPDSLLFQPRRTDVLLALYDSLPVADLTSIDLAPDPTVSRTPTLDYSPLGADALPGLGYVFELPFGSTVSYGAVRPTHVGDRFVILEWSFQTDPNNPELRKSRKP
jgi:hypothetical protein